ncbi:MAG: IclR family transcriptional regulator [Acidimicrobiales bacterium]
MSSVQSVDRAFSLLEAISRRPSGISELSRELDLATSTVARLLDTLEKLSAVERTNQGLFRIGSSILTMAASVDPARNITAVAQTHLVDLVEQLGEVAGLSIEVGYDVHYVTQVDSPNEVQVRDWTGERLPMHVVSSGLVFLAHWDETDLESFLERKLDQFTPDSINDPVELHRRIEQVRKDGFAWTHDELAVGLSSLAAPIYGVAGTIIGALHCHGPSYRFPIAGQEAWITAQVVDRTNRISASLGFRQG